MCQQVDVLHRTPQGYVSRCPKCETIFIAYQTTALSLHQTDFEAFQNELGKELERKKEKCAAYPNHKNIMFSTPSDQVKILLCYREMSQLYEMLSEAWLMIEVNQIIREPNESS
ncbi:MAG: DUF6686 family protein [Bacteroidota bacterium]